ncbi:MAG: DUF1540 domain-containing protein [Firmicutes bacterium]|nr:DUF1540 domain-containing protein [Candidatus Caballimonas caccae]
MNSSVKCDVKTCKHNEKGCNCKLNSIKVTCASKDSCTCCDDFCER